jgi:hypothetical protein
VISFVAETSPNCSMRTPEWRLLRRGHGGQRLLDELLDLLVGARHLERDGDGAAVLRDGVDPVGRRERALDPGDPGDGGEAAHDVPHGRGDLGIVDVVEPLPWMSTCSPALSGKPAASTSMSPRLDSPLPDADSSIVSSPTRPPMTVARTTNRIQPRMAVLRCCALQRPALAA